MGKAVIEVNGIDTFLKHINTVVSHDKIKRAIKVATMNVEATAKHLCPVDTGNLRNRIHMSVKEDGETIIGRVSNDTEYAMFVEFGTGVRGEASDYPKANQLGLSYRPDWKGQKAQPFMYPALKQNEDFIKALIKDAVKGE